MNQKLQRFFEPDIRLFFSVLLLFAAVTLYFHLPAGLIELAAIGLLLVHYLATKSRRQKDMMQYVDKLTVQVDEAAKDTMLNAPLPMVIFRPERDEIVWSNDKFLAIANEREHMFDVKLSDVLPGFSANWLMEGESRCPDLVELHDKRFMVFGNLVRGEERGRRSMIATTYWVEVTDYAAIDEEFHSSRPVSAILCIDNYEEMFKNVSDSVRSSLISEIEARLNEWTEQTGGIFTRYDRDHYLFFFEERYLDILIEQRFSVLDSIREVVSPAGIAATLSIGIGRDAPGFAELYQYATLSLEMALSRGGDQAVIKNKFSFEFFGGRGMEVETRTKVKSRVTANALAELVRGSDQVFIMGHKQSDMDCIGAAAGLSCICRKLKTSVKIVVDAQENVSKKLIAYLEEAPEYKGVFISPEDAMIRATSRTLLIVVDTNRPEQVQSRPLLESINRIAVIDHHRRAASYIQNASITFHEPYASSACELVAELMQETVEQPDILRCETEAVLSGIVLDTKNFSLRTGEKTFDAAAFLRRLGADTVQVKKMLQGDMDENVAKFKILQTVRHYRDSIAMAVCEQEQERIVAAKAADEMLNISGVDASIVAYPTSAGGVVVSARSIGDVNVQLLLENLGGGGNMSAAGAQVDNMSIKDAVNTICKSIDEYIDG